MIRCEQVSKRFFRGTRGIQAVEEISLEVRRGEFLAVVGPSGCGKSTLLNLTGGMRKRVTLARTLIYDPESLLMDEPFGALDAQLKLVLQDELLRIWEASRKTIVFVTHDLTEAVSLADRVVVVSARPGRVKLVEEISLPRPRDVFRVRFSARFGEHFERLWERLREDLRKGEEV